MKKTRTTLWMALAAMAGVVGATQATSPSDIVVSDVYSAPGFGEIRLLGICNVQETSLACWDDDRRPDKDLSKHVADLFKAATPGGGGNMDVPFRFRRKNRLAFFRFPVAAYNAMQPISLESIRAPDGGNLQPIWPLNRTDKTWQTDYLPIDTDRKSAKTSIYATVLSAIGGPVELPVRVGASGSSAGGSISIGSIARTTSQVTMAFDQNPADAWNILFKVPGDSPTSKLRIVVDPLDEKGNSIQWVTPDGKPMPTLTALDQMRSYKPDVPRPRFVNGYNTVPFQPELGGRQWTLFVDPKYVSAVRITFKTSKIVEFKDVPLDPKP